MKQSQRFSCNCEALPRPGIAGVSRSPGRGGRASDWSIAGGIRRENGQSRGVPSQLTGDMGMGIPQLWGKGYEEPVIEAGLT